MPDISRSSSGGSSAQGAAARLKRLLRDDLARHLARDGFKSVVVKLLASLLSLVMMVGAARAMSPAEFGLFGFGFSLAMVLSMAAALGLHIGVLRWRQEYDVQGRPALAEGVERWGLNMTLAASVLLGLALVAVGWALSSMGLADLAAGGALHPAILTGIAALTATLAVSQYLASVLRGRGEILIALIPREILWRGGITAGGFALGGLGLGLDAAAALGLAAGLLAALSLWQALHARLGVGRGGGGAPAFGFSGEARSWATQGSAMMGATLLTAVTRYFNVVLLGVFLPPERTGLFFACVSASQALLLILMGSNMVSAPLIARFHHSGDRAGVQRVLKLTMLGIAPPTLVGFGLMWIFGDRILALFDPSFAGATGLLALLAGGTAFSALAGPTSYTLQLAGRERRMLRILAVVNLLSIASQLVVIPTFGLWGAAVVNVATIIAWNGWAAIACRRELGVDPSAFVFLRKPEVSAP